MQVNDSSFVFEIDRIPPSINHAYIMRRTKKGIMRVRTKEFIDFQTCVHGMFPEKYEELQNDGHTVLKKDVKPLAGRLGVSISVCYGDNRKRDIDNSVKVIFDSLQGKAFEDDSQIDYFEVKRREGIQPNIKIRVWDLFGSKMRTAKCAVCGRTYNKDDLMEKYKREHGMVVYIGHVCNWCF